MTELPADVLMRLGPSPQDLTRLGSSRVLRGNGLVAKTGSPEGIAREAFLFGEAAALLPVGTPTLVASGPDWLLMEDVGGEPASPEDVTPLAQLALDARAVRGRHRHRARAVPRCVRARA